MSSRFVVRADELGSDPGESTIRATNHIILGDCLDVLRRFPDGSIDLIHTSPPYNIDKGYQADFRDRRHIESYADFLAAVIFEMRRVLAPNGSLFWQTGYTDAENGIEGDIMPIDHISYGYFRESPNELILWDRIIWRYFGGMAFKRKFTNRHETILWWVKPVDGTVQPVFDVDAVRERSRELDKRNAFWGKNPGNVWDVDRVAFGTTEATSHIAVYPEEVAEKIIRAASRPGDLVLDPFSGSGTTPKVARGLGRRWIGIELSAVYAEEAARRIGFQQPNEVLSLASHLVKRRVFGGQRAQRKRQDVLEGLRSWWMEIDVPKARAQYHAILDEVFPDGVGGREVKAAKPDAWSRFDRLLGPDEGNGVLEVHQLLSLDFRNRRTMNGPTAYRTALEAAESLGSLIESDSPEEFVGELLLNEPSSYLLDGESVHLLQTQKLAKTVAAGWSDFMDGLREDYAGRPSAELAEWVAFGLERTREPRGEDEYRDLLSDHAMFGETRLKAVALGSDLFWRIRDDVVRAFGSPTRIGHRQVFAFTVRALAELEGQSASVLEAIPIAEHNFSHSN